MIKTFTQNDIIRFLYHETSEEENAEIESALLCDSELLEMYQELCLLTKQLDKIEIVPSEKVIKRVVKYSKSLGQHA